MKSMELIAMKELELVELIWLEVGQDIFCLLKARQFITYVT